MENIKLYFESCKQYWINSGDSQGVATVKALWWDCVDVWNADKSWNEDKIAFVNQYRKYKPYDPIPETNMIMVGNA